MDYTIPQYFLDKNINHFSPSQANMPVDQWYWKYFNCDQETRRSFKGSSKMNSGVQVGNGLDQWITSGVQPKTMSEVKGSKPYLAVDDKDRLQIDQDKESFLPTILNAYKAYEEVGILKEDKILFENYVSGTFEGVFLPTIGRTDAQSKKLIIELKTKWRSQKTGTKKDGTPFAASKSSSPKKPNYNHLLQTAFYYSFTKNVKAFLVYASEKDYAIFDIDEFFPKDLMHEFRNKLLVKQNLAANNDGKKFIEPDFSHFGWDIGTEHLEKAKEFYGYNRQNS